MTARSADALAAVTLVVSFVFSYAPDGTRMPLGAALLISVVAAAAVRLSGPRPVAALVVVVVLALGLPAIGSTFAVMDLVVVFVVFQVVLTADLPLWLVATVCLVTLTVDDAWRRTADGQGFMEPSVLYPLLLTALSVGLGAQSRQVRRQHAELVALRDADQRRAVSDERRRIARDLHDVAAHHLSALVVRTKLARRVDTVEALTQAVDFTAETAAEALDSLRHVVHVLNTEDDVPLAPLTDLDGVLARMDAAGLHVERAGEVGTAGGEVDIAVVRIVSEALANVLAHRGPGRAWLDVAREGATVAVTVEDDGPSVWPATEPARPDGYGLIGMRERAQACGGTLTVGPSARGGWKVSAVLPVP